MIDSTRIPVAILIKSLRSKVCPSCGCGKSAGMSVCRPCFSHLQREKGIALYQLIGQGYEKAFAAAMADLMFTTIHLPGCKRIAPAAYVDDQTDTLHIDIPEMLYVLNLQNTPENQDEAERVCRNLVTALYPQTKVTSV